MSNTFEILKFRFDVNDSKRLLIQGWFMENKIRNCTLLVYINGKKQELEIQERKGREVAAKALHPVFNIDREYYVWVNLPEDVNEDQYFEMYRVENDKKHLIVKNKMKDILKEQKRIPVCVDGISYTDQLATIRGWYVSTEKVKLVVKTLRGETLEIQSEDLEKGIRKDVVFEFPEVEKEAVTVFEITTKVEKGDRVFLVAKSKNKGTQITCRLSITRVEKLIHKADVLMHKGVAYYQRYGFSEFVKRVYEKTFKVGECKYTYDEWLKRHLPTDKELARQRSEKFEYSPKISIVIPLYKTPLNYLDELVQSVRNQTYSNWELCFSDGSGENSPLTETLEKYQKLDSRIKVIYTKEKMQISENTNCAMQIATGDFIAFADHDDLLAPNALYENVLAMNHEPDIDAIYSDEDKTTMDGKEYFQPHFKPDFNVDLLNTTNYFCHFFMVSAKIVEEIGGLNSEFDGAQDYDFVLRCSEKAKHIHHIPKILYHWRAHKDSTAENPASKMYAFEAGGRAIKAHYDRCGISADVTSTECLGVYRSKYHLQDTPLVSILIPSKDHIEDLELCIRSIEEKATYKNIEYIIIENNSEEKATFEFYKKLEAENPRVKVIYWKDEFNYSAINNFGVKYAKGDYLLFLNNDTEIINPDCIEELLAYCMREDVGAVGARLYYPDDTIQHAGVIVGLGGIAGHAFINTPKNSPGYFARIISVQDYSAVTAACVMVKRSVFEEVNGFDEKFKVAFNDIDLCLKIRRTGHLVVYNPYAELYHYESKSRGAEDTPEKKKRFASEIERFEKKWRKFLDEGDPYYNVNLTLNRHDFSLRP